MSRTVVEHLVTSAILDTRRWRAVLVGACGLWIPWELPADSLRKRGLQPKWVHEPKRVLSSVFEEIEPPNQPKPVLSDEPPYSRVVVPSPVVVEPDLWVLRWTPFSGQPEGWNKVGRGRGSWVRPSQALQSGDEGMSA